LGSECKIEIEDKHFLALTSQNINGRNFVGQSCKEKLIFLKKKVHKKLQVSITTNVASDGNVEISFVSEVGSPRVADDVVGNGRRPVVAHDLDGVVETQGAAVAVELDHSAQVVLPVERIHCHRHRTVGGDHLQQILLAAHVAENQFNMIKLTKNL